MSVNEELEEHAHHAQEPFDKRVAATMAIIAALLAIVSVLGSHYSTETLLSQQLASDEWSYYQGKTTRRYIAQATHDSVAAVKGDHPAAAKYAKDEAKYTTDATEIQEKAREFEKERTKSSHIANRFHFGEVFLEMAIVFSSLSILSKKRSLYFGGMTAALVGILISFTAYWA